MYMNCCAARLSVCEGRSTRTKVGLRAAVSFLIGRRSTKRRRLHSFLCRFSLLEL